RAGRHSQQRHHHCVLSVAAGLPAAARRLCFGSGHGATADDAGVLGAQYPIPRARHGGRLMARASAVPLPTAVGTTRPALRRRLEVVFWYGVLTAIALVTMLPFVWILLTSLKGPLDAIYS